MVTTENDACPGLWYVSGLIVEWQKGLNMTHVEHHQYYKETQQRKQQYFFAWREGCDLRGRNYRFATSYITFLT